MCLDGLKEVSIHAPVKGRPGVTAPARNRERVSIHAPVKGRLPTVAGRAVCHAVSIHAPVKGRLGIQTVGRAHFAFQSTPP